MRQHLPEADLAPDRWAASDRGDVTHMAAMTFKSLEQLQYWQGQALRSRDFNDQLSSAEQLRWWHNRASHGTFGVGFGLTMDRSGTLRCGVAYDCFGRELVVPLDRDFKPVASAEPQYLVVTWGATGAQLAWIYRDQARATSGILLARADPAAVIDPTFHAVQSRALSRPRLSSGATPPGNTPWEKIKSANGTPIGLQVHIDASAAGFTKRPLYLASLVWTKGQNRRFTPPYVTIADPKEDGFTVRLLLQGIGQEAFKVASDITTVSTKEWKDPKHKVGTLLSDDLVSRLLPRIKKALRIDSLASGGALNLAGAPASVGLEAPDAVALANLPRNPAVVRATKAIEVNDDTLLAAGKRVLRRGGVVAGSAAAIERVLSNKRLLTRTDISGLQATDRLDILQKTITVSALDPADDSIVTFTAKTGLIGGEILVRLSDAIESEVPVEVVGPLAKKNTIKLKTPIPRLAPGDELGIAKPGKVVVSALVDALTTKEADQCRAGDVLRAADGSMTIVTSIEESVLLLEAALPVAAGTGTVSIGDYAVKSTILETPVSANVKVGNPGQFAVGDVVALLRGTEQEATAIGTVKGFVANALTLDKALTGAQAGDVVAAVRFSAPSPIMSLSPLTVADSREFRIGDLVALTNTPTIECWEISNIQGNVLSLKSGAPTVMGTLAVVFVDTVASIKAVGASSITIDSPNIARAGWFAAPVDRWIEATAPVVLSVMLPDGTLPGDSIGLASLRLLQPVIRFGSDVEVAQSARLFMQGPDEFTRLVQQVSVEVATINGVNRAALRFFGASGFALRPEELSVVAGFSETLADDFAAYAQTQGLSLCWLGCQIPPPPPADCPGIRDVGPCSCHS
jgi:hypothetical protein